MILDVVTDPNTANPPPDPKTNVLETRERSPSRDAAAECVCRHLTREGVEVPT